MEILDKEIEGYILTQTHFEKDRENKKNFYHEWMDEKDKEDLNKKKKS